MNLSKFDILVYKRQEPRFMRFVDSKQCAAYWASTGKLSVFFFLAGSDLIFDDFRICCSSEKQALNLSRYLSY